MPEPFSVLSFGVAAIYAVARPRSAVSDEADRVRRMAGQIIERVVEGSSALYGPQMRLITALRRLAVSHAAPGWDGDDAAAVDADAIDIAVAFVRALPEDCDLPEPGVDPDGAVSLDWTPSRYRMLSVGCSGSSDRLAYAWVDGTNRGHAVERFDRASVPQRLKDAIRVVTGRPRRAALRAA